MTTTEVWFRNPHNYIRELVEVGATTVAWDRGILAKRRINAYQHAKLYFATQPNWRLLLVGEQGTAELRLGHDIDEPVGVYPTWSAEHDEYAILEEMVENPIGEDSQACNNPNLPPDERPVAGQEHRVVLIDLPPMTSGVGRRLARQLKELQEDNPECILHLHGLYSWRVMFGFGFAAVDADPRTNAGKGKVYLPNGKEIFAEKAVNTPQWVTVVGMKPSDLTREPRNRCIYNIKTAQWAGAHYRDVIAFATQGDHRVDPKDPVHKPKETRDYLSKSVAAQPGDKLQCNMCSLQNSCKYYREGSVCSVPGSEPAQLANQFNTRDADHIIDGLGTLLSFQTRRLERGAREEEDFGELDPEVTKLANSIFTNGVKLAKLLNPALNGGPKVQVNVGGNAAAVQASTPNQVMGAIVRELESRGIARKDITPDMVANLLREMTAEGGAPKAIEGQVLSRSE